MSLAWTNLEGSDQALAYRSGEGLVALQTLPGPATLTVLADLESHTYSISIDGVLIKSDIPFNDTVNLDTVRFLTSELDEANFSDRCFDNLEVSILPAGEEQGSTVIVTLALAGLRSALHQAWQWLGWQLAVIRQAFAPTTAHAAPPPGAAFPSYYFANGTRVAMRVEGDPDASRNGLYFFLHDHPSLRSGQALGSPTVTLKRNGDGTLAKVGELRYNPWGRERASGFDASLTPTDYRFTDQREESSFGVYHYNARWYDPIFGRFAQADTVIPDLKNSQSWDRYAYARNNLLRYVDPSGHIPGPPPVCPYGCPIWDYSNIGGSGFGGRLLRSFISTGTELVDFLLTNGATYTDPQNCTWNLATAEDRFIAGAIPPTLLGVTGGRQLPLPGFEQYLDDTTYQIHHLITNKGDYWPGVMREITDKYKLDLDGSWNKMPLPGHSGSHTEQYHKWVYQQLKAIDDIAKGDKNLFLELFDKMVKKPVLENPRLPHRQ